MSWQNRYELRDKLGAGGMGIVYTARDRLTGNIIALKRVLIPPEKVGDESASDLLTAIATEFRTLAGLRHPHVIRVMDYGFIHDSSIPQPYFTMEYLPDARTLTNAATSQPPDTQVRLLTEMLLALAYLHRRGVIHRDLKPENVLVDGSGHVKVLDFGLALGIIGKSTAGSPENIAGTMAYMAPELFADENATVQSDLYAVGILMYEVFTGNYPFNRKNMLVLLNDIVNTTPDVSPLTVDLGNLIARLLKKDPAQRPADANAVIRELCTAMGQPIPVESTIIRESFLQASRFVGRTAELELLKTALDNMLKEQTVQMYLIAGESGVGKSRLLDELRTRALVKGAIVLRGQGVAEAGLPWQLWRDMAQELALSTSLSDLEASIVKQIVPDINTLLNRDIMDAPELTGDAGQQRLVLTLVDLLKRQNDPVVLLLEDLHWAQASLAPLKQLLAVREQLPRLLIIGTYRDDEQPNLPDEVPGAHWLKLHRLDEGEMSELAQSMLGNTGTQAEVLDLLRRETEGNAFFMVETVRALAEEAGTLSDIGRGTLPQQVFAGGVQQIVRRRLNRVPEYARPLLNRAAVAGRLLDLIVLQHLAETDLNEFLTAGIHAGVLEIVEERWRFAHDKLREMVIADLTKEEFQRLHRQTAQAVELVYPNDKTYTLPLLEHWRAAKDRHKELHYSIAAGEQWVIISAYHQAKSVLAHWIQPENLPLVSQSQLVKILELLGRVNENLGDYAEAARLYEQSLALAQVLNDHPATANALSGLGHMVLRVSNFDAAENYAQRSLELYQNGNDAAGTARSTGDLGSIAYFRGDYDIAQRYFLQSLAIHRTANDQYAMANTLQSLGDTARLQGKYDDAMTYQQQSIAVRQAIGDKNGLSYSLYSLGIVAYIQQDYAAAWEHFAKSLATATEVGNFHAIARGMSGLGIVAYYQQDYGRALEFHHKAIELMRIRQYERDLAVTLGGLVRVQIKLGAVAEAWVALREGLTIAVRLASQPRLLWLLNSAVMLLMTEGKLEAAAEIGGLTASHLATDNENKTDVERLLPDMEASLGTERLATALERGRSLDLDTVVQKLLGEQAPE